MDKVFIISDLHLCQDRQDLFLLFQYFMEEIAPSSTQLYVLGDLFETWIGDDSLNITNDDTRFNLQVIDYFKRYSDGDKSLYFIHGNRDFLLGNEFEKRTGGKVLQEPHLLNFATKKTALLHGDSFCTDDHNYQQFRSMVRTSEWQLQFLSLSIDERTKIATQLRQKSKDAQLDKSSEIMDVNQSDVVDFIESNKLDWLIHGHTHRQANHMIKSKHGAAQRIVLSDWGKRGFYLEISNGHCSTNYFER